MELTAEVEVEQQAKRSREIRRWKTYTVVLALADGILLLVLAATKLLTLSIGLLQGVGR